MIARSCALSSCNTVQVELYITTWLRRVNQNKLFVWHWNIFPCQDTISCRAKWEICSYSFCREALSLVNVTRSDCVNYRGLHDESHDLGYSYPILHAILAERVHGVDDCAAVVHGYGTVAVFSLSNKTQCWLVGLFTQTSLSQFSAVGRKQTLMATRLVAHITWWARAAVHRSHGSQERDASIWLFTKTKRLSHGPTRSVLQNAVSEHEAENQMAGIHTSYCEPWDWHQNWSLEGQKTWTMLLFSCDLPMFSWRRDQRYDEWIN